MLDINKLSKNHLEWANDHTAFKQLKSGAVRIESPFFDSFNDGLVMYAIQDASSGKITLTDDGWTNENLENHGLYISRSPSRKKILTDQLKSYGVQWVDEELTITGSENDFGQMKVRMLQAMIFVNDMFILAPKHTSNFFFDDLDVYFSSHNIRVLKNASFMGLSGLTHNFEFSIAGTEKIPRKLIKLLSTPNNSVFAKAIFTDIYETKQQQIEPTNFFVILNNRNRKNETKEINPDITELFNQIGAIPVLYTERSQYVDTFSE
ncbi:DUF1828 domain-containing protein [Lacticaseibacillus saniviri]